MSSLFKTKKPKKKKQFDDITFQLNLALSKFPKSLPFPKQQVSRVLLGHEGRRGKGLGSAPSLPHHAAGDQLIGVPGEKPSHLTSLATEG